MVHASKECNLCCNRDRRISTESKYWEWYVVLWDEGKVLKGRMLTSKLVESAKEAHEKYGQRGEKQCRER